MQEEAAAAAQEHPFRHTLKLGPGNVVRGSDAKKLRARLGSARKGQLKQCKLLGAKTQLYLEDNGDPVAFQVRGAALRPPV